MRKPIFLFSIGAAAWLISLVPALARDYQFDGKISREVLENYLSRSVSYTEILHDDLTLPRNGRGVDPKDHLRFIVDTKTKFIGRAIMIWGKEENLPVFLKAAKPYAEAIHEADPDIILQAAAFEIVTPGVENLTVPESVLKEFGQTVEDRKFRYQDMLYQDGTFVNHWGRGSVPDMSRIETRMWFYHLVTCYIDIGIEAIHFGQVGLMDGRDPGHAGWLDMLGRTRAYAKTHARRHLLVCDAHAPTGGFVEDGKLLFDFHSFPLRIAEVEGQPMKGELKVGFVDAIFTKSKGGITPSGWSCENLPYIVEFDNFGRSKTPGQPSGQPYIWGFDEITWFAQMPEQERIDWLRYAWKWLGENDENGHLQMPGSRLLTPASQDGPRWYWANTRSNACPQGSNTESTIKELWEFDN